MMLDSETEYKEGLPKEAVILKDFASLTIA